jgi:SAM-dependent methyltransferase
LTPNRSAVEYPPSQDYSKYFAEILDREIQEGSSVLEIGSGDALQPSLLEVRRKFGNLTGIDISSDVLSNISLDRAIHSPFEQYDFKGEYFDHAFAYNVLEHIEKPEQFMKQLGKVIKPGGTFWSLSPHADHPFSRISRAVEVLGFKMTYRKFMQSDDGYHGINDYPAYYRLNNRRAVNNLTVASDAKFESPQFVLLNAGWESYFPTGLKWLPILFDKAFIETFPGFRLIFVFGIRIK